MAKPLQLLPLSISDEDSHQRLLIMSSIKIPAVVEPSKPVVKSRLKRLFRISVSEPTAATTAEPSEPSSVCLAKMVQNFIEESNEKASQSPAVRCGRNRCNCFNGNGSDGSDGESDNTVSSADVCDFLKSLVVCASMNERNVLADTAKIVADKKTCKRKDELRKIVTEGLMTLGYDSAICKSKWEKSPTFPAVGEGQMAYYAEIKLIVKSMLAQAKSLTASIEDISLKVQVKLGSTDAKYVRRWQVKRLSSKIEKRKLTRYRVEKVHRG